MDIGNAVKIIRKKKNISQKELANLCELSTNAICSIENGATFPSKNSIQRFAKLWIYLNLIYYYSAFQKRIFPEDKRILYKTLCTSIKEDLIEKL